MLRQSRTLRINKIAYIHCNSLWIPGRAKRGVITKCQAARCRSIFLVSLNEPKPTVSIGSLACFRLFLLVYKQKEEEKRLPGLKSEPEGIAFLLTPEGLF